MVEPLIITNFPLDRVSAQLNLSEKLVDSFVYRENTNSYLGFDEQGCFYQQAGVGKIRFDFLLYLKRFQASHAARGPLYSALKKERNSQIIDATVGSGKDSALLLSWGFNLIGYERNPLLFLLLADARQRLIKREPKYSEKFTLRFGSWFAESKSTSKIRQVLYYDPMYPQAESSKKSALPRQDIQFFRQFIGEDLDIENNLKVAVESADKTILKRSLHSKWNFSTSFSADHSYKGKSTRYDIFFNKKLS